MPIRGRSPSKLGLRGIRNSLRQPQQFQTQICALLRAAARGPLRVMFPMVTDVEDWDAAMSIVEHCRQSLRERGVPFNENTQFGVMLSIPAACLTEEDFVAHGCGFSGHRHQRPDPVHPRRRPGTCQRGALLPPRQSGYEKADHHGDGLPPMRTTSR